MLYLKDHFPSTATSKFFDDQLVDFPSDDWYWFGNGITNLSLTRDVTVEALRALRANRHPIGNELLVTFPEEELPKPLPLFTEVVVTMPRMVSVLAGTDDKIFSVHRRASDAAMRKLEIYAAAPVWEGSIPFIDTTSNVVAAVTYCSFRYLGTEIIQSRYLLFNLTFNENQEEWMFLDTAEMDIESSYTNDDYLSNLADGLKHRGHDLTELQLREFEASEWSLIKHLN